VNHRRVALLTELYEPALLRDGTVVDVCAAGAEDLDTLVDFHLALSRRSRAQRFFSLGVDVRATLARVLAPPATNLMATAGSCTVAHACLVPDGERSAELAFAVADDWHGHGVATVLLERLAEEAGRQGLTTLTAEVLVGNQAMLDVFGDAGLPITMHAQAGSVIVEMPAGVGPGARERFAARHRAAAVAGLEHILRPASIAVIGAGERRGSVGGELLRNLLAGGYRGELHAVHRGAGAVAGVPAVGRAEDLPAGVDLAVIAVPAADVQRVAHGCAAAGVRSLVVISAGFGEAGGVGRRRQGRLLALCREAGMRLVGPNCLGVVNTDPVVAMNATFAPQAVPAGGIALASQSGAVGIMAMDLAARRGVGLSAFVSLGDRADVSSNDLLLAWAQDPRTRVIGLYLESFGNPRAFARVAAEVARTTPIVAVKAGRSAAGRRATASHTGAMVEGSDALADTLLAEAGVIRVDTVGELFDVATILDRSGLPPGDRVAVLTNAGGAGIAFADAAEGAGLRLPRLRATTRRRLRTIRPQATLANPVDLLADVSGRDYNEALRVLAADDRVDALVALHLTPIAGVEDHTTAGIGAVSAEVDKPIVAVPLAQPVPPELAATAAVLETPEDAARALGRIARHVQRRGRPPAETASPPGIDRVGAAAVIARALERGPGWLQSEEAAAVATAYGIPLAASCTVVAASAIVAAAAHLQAPLAVKAVAPGLVHKSEAGAVALGLRTPEAAADAAVELAERMAAGGFDVEGFLVQEMVAGGVELLAGAVSDASFGPVIACGAGGVTAELWRDVQVRLAPVGAQVATEMLQELQCFPLLRGWRGALPADVGAVADVLWRLGTLAADRPEIAEVECNPLIALPDRAVAVDLRLRVA